jgi:hypothetical protein
MKAGVFPYQHQLPQRESEPASDGKQAGDWQVKVARSGRPATPTGEDLATASRAKPYFPEPSTFSSNHI